MSMKAQSAMEYLMTYGWAILIVIIVAAALYALGIFNPATYTQSTAVGFQGFQVPTGGWQVNDTTVTVVLKNMAGANINITNIEATYAGTTTGSVSPDLTANGGALAPNGQATFFLDGGDYAGPDSGASYSVTIEVTYDNLASGLTGFPSTGTITGTAS
jgi:hypothetical protein